jgi:type IV pilus biogenesis protein CpaD/CtpE
MLAAMSVLGMTLAACSDVYYDRRETLTLSAGNAVASNIAAQTVDPWPPAAGDRNIPMDGELAQKAAERYRTNKVTPPQGIGTSSLQFGTNPGAPPPAAPAASPGQ